MTRTSGIALFVYIPFALSAQGGEKELRANADALFAKGEYAQAFQPYQTLVGNNQQDFDLNYRYGVCALYSGADKEEAIKYLKRATQGPDPQALVWYFLGKAHHLSYEFKEALVAYDRYRGTADKKTLGERPVDALELQCRNGQNLLSNLKEIDVHNKVEVVSDDFFRFYDLSSIGGKIVVTPEELKSSLDKKSKDRCLVYLPDKGGPIYFASYGKGGTTGRDIYRTEVMPNGEFATPVKLAGYINTDQDEDFPFMAPDGKSFYFCSKGHNSMGGYDVFKSTYDKGLDVFGAPVNLDFAVNTPDDDLLYLTDPEGKEACFASGRDSKQGMLHVYRVSTAQAPVNITVLKGTFASTFDEKDRKAHIRVLDALTQETVADVNTDLNGTYVLALPRSGKYRFMVEAGPSGKTHAGVVDVPRNEEPRAYRQEMSLVDQGGEKLMIKNYFDQPLEEDIMALALDEIKRRAKLNVSAAAVAEEKLEVPATGDPLTRAGFTGDVSKQDAQRMASEDAALLRATTDDLEKQSVAAYSIALENAGLADDFTRKAEELVAEANAESDETRKNDLMTDAARQRQNARAANQRATAALRAGESLATERMATSLKAQKAEKLSAELTRLLPGSDDNASVIKLVELKARMDEKNAPDGSIAVAEKMRRAATDREHDAAAALQRANTARGEENELVDRVSRKKREENDAKGNKKENLARERAELESQLAAMRQENERAFAKARIAEHETANARGQAALAKHLATAAAGMTVNELTEEQIGDLAQRISGNGSRIAAIGVDERYDAAIALETKELEQHTFDWGAPLGSGSGEPLATTRTMERDSTNQARHTEMGGVAMERGGLAPGQVREGGAVEAPGAISASGEPDATGQQAVAANTVAQNAGGTTDHPAEPVGVARTDTDLASVRGVVTPSEGSAAETGSVADNTSGTDGRVAAEAPHDAPSTEELAFVQANELAELKQVRAAEKNKARKDSLDTRIADLEREMRETARTEEAGTSGSQNDNDPTANAVVVPAASTVDNTGSQPTGNVQPATVAQPGGSAGTDNAQEATADNQIGAASPENAQAMADSISASRPALEFAPTVSDELVIGDVFADYTANKQSIERDITDVQERSTGLHGLELMLVDSLDAENNRQLSHLDRHPEEASTVLARVNRLRSMKEDHVREAERVLAQGQQEYATGESRTLEDAALARDQQAPERDGGGTEVQASATPHNDNYVRVAADREQVYTSLMENRSAKADEAVRERDQDMVTLTGLEERIDSLEAVLENMPMGKEQQKLRDRTDRLIDDHMILRTEIGQRTGYITGLEFKAAQDSTKELTASTGKLGLPPNEPMLLLAGSMEDAAKQDMQRAALLRKQADRSEDIVLRDSLLRTAYRQELGALRDMDRSHTVRNFILSDGYQRGTDLSYEAVERRMFGGAEEPAIAETRPMDNTAPAAIAAPDVAQQTAGAQQTSGSAVSAARYKEFMSGDTASSSVGELPNGDAPVLLVQARSSADRSRELESASVTMADRANATQDSVATAKRSDRDRLEREAGRLRLLSDSLHQASVLEGERAEELGHRAETASDVTAFRKRLLKYYYLDDQEQAMVLNDIDRSRYFQARAKALEQREEAVRAHEQAAGTKQLADTMLQQSKDILANPNPGGAPLTPDQMAQAGQLTDQVVRLTHRVDSLNAAERRLNSAAALNEAQAASILQALPPDRGTEIMAMEQRARRVEPELALARSMQGADATGTPLVAGAPVANNAVPPAQEEPRAGTTPAASGAAQHPEATADANRAGPPAGVPPPTPAGAPRLLEPLMADVFEMNASAVSRTGPIPIDQPMPAGVVFKVQIGAFKQPIPDELFGDLVPVSGESVGNGLTRYTAGMFTNAQGAARATEQVREHGYRDAFVVAYQDGRRVPLAQAMRAARPATATAPLIADLPVGPPVEIRVPANAFSVTRLPDTASVADQEVLARYPASAEQVLAQFAPPADATSYYSDPKAAPARQVETVKGLFFTVQVGVYSKPTALDKLFNITPLNSERTETNKIRYTTGVFTDMEKVRSRKDQTVGLGVKDAFITAYLNGKRIPMRDARALILRFGPSVFVDPTIITR